MYLCSYNKKSMDRKRRFCHQPSSRYRYNNNSSRYKTYILVPSKPIISTSTISLLIPSDRSSCTKSAAVGTWNPASPSTKIKFYNFYATNGSQCFKINLRIHKMFFNHLNLLKICHSLEQQVKS